MSITISHSALSVKDTDWYFHSANKMSQMSQLMGIWYLPHRRPAMLRRACTSVQSRQRQTKGPTKKQTSSPTGWLRMRVWRMSLWRTKSAIISWAGSYQLENDSSLLIPNWQAQKKIYFYHRSHWQWLIQANNTHLWQWKLLIQAN